MELRSGYSVQKQFTVTTHLAITPEPSSACAVKTAVPLLTGVRWDSLNTVGHPIFTRTTELSLHVHLQAFVVAFAGLNVVLMQ